MSLLRSYMGIRHCILFFILIFSCKTVDKEENVLKQSDIGLASSATSTLNFAMGFKVSIVNGVNMIRFVTCSGGVDAANRNSLNSQLALENAVFPNNAVIFRMSIPSSNPTNPPLQGMCTSRWYDTVANTDKKFREFNYFNMITLYEARDQMSLMVGGLTLALLSLACPLTAGASCLYGISYGAMAAMTVGSAQAIGIHNDPNRWDTKWSEARDLIRKRDVIDKGTVLSFESYNAVVTMYNEILKP